MLLLVPELDAELEPDWKRWQTCKAHAHVQGTLACIAGIPATVLLPHIAAAVCDAYGMTLQGNMQELRMLRKQRDALDDQIQRLEWQLSNSTLGGFGGVALELSCIQVVSALLRSKEAC